MSLPPFSGDEPTCIKCGQTGAHTEYIPARTVRWTGYQATECLQRNCRRCGYAWDEAVVPPCPCTENSICSSCYDRRYP
ncbi:hypothetical protein [Streptomyces sp. NPDC086023]|uniref:hypothetical protein n=1 Tax=Streptomyces sp. NPDC086023 TaxID=3365746 RepID=UPI0037D7F331